MPDSSRAAALLVAAAAFAVSAAVVDPLGLAANTKPAPQYRIAAGAPSKKAPPKDAPPAPITTIASSTIKGVTVSVEYADAARRAAYLKTVDPDLIDPFAPAKGKPERALVFVVGFQNDTAGEVQFQPGNVMLVTDAGDHDYPLDLTDIYIGAERAGDQDLEHVIDRTTRVLFDSATTIPPGGHMARLLAFKPLESPKWRQFSLQFSFIQIAGETHDVSFAFHKQLVEPGS
ncbi:MAG TPA: hypothetical protein VFC25_03570 [Verrucomicrobiae bacterium]|nr:hypothetical protein [Verrucomicrobiae bacterium]